MKAILSLLIFITTLTNAQVIEIGETNLKMSISNNEIQVKTFDEVTALYLNPVGGDIIFGDGLGGSIIYDSQNSRTGLGTAPQSRFHIGGNTDASLSTHGLMMLGQGTTSANLILDANEIMARNNGSASTLTLNAEGGDVVIGPGALIAQGLTLGDFATVQYNTTNKQFYYDGSSLRYKENITPLKDDWTKILQLQPVTYTRPGNPMRWEYGYIAEEIDSIGLTTMVGYDAEGKPEDVRYDKMILYLVEMLKIQQEEINFLKKKILTNDR